MKNEGIREAGVYNDHGKPVDMAGFWNDTFVKDGNTWKIRVNSFATKGD